MKTTADTCSTPAGTAALAPWVIAMVAVPRAAGAPGGSDPT